MFHRHHWQEVARRFVPPSDRLTNFKTYDDDGLGAMYDIINGYTVIELRCSECGDVTSRKLHGDAT
jgi:hypothetical protein